MKNYLQLSKKKTLHLIYLSTLKIIDLSEWIYNKLNTLKADYKYELIHLFDEKDSSTESQSVDTNIENKYLKLIMRWLASLFGSIEEVSEVYRSKIKTSSFFIKKLGSFNLKSNLINNVSFFTVWYILIFTAQSAFT